MSVLVYIKKKNDLLERMGGVRAERNKQMKWKRQSKTRWSKQKKKKHFFFSGRNN